MVAQRVPPSLFSSPLQSSPLMVTSFKTPLSQQPEKNLERFGRRDFIRVVTDEKKSLSKTSCEWMPRSANSNDLYVFRQFGSGVTYLPLSNHETLFLWFYFTCSHELLGECGWLANTTKRNAMEVIPCYHLTLSIPKVKSTLNQKKGFL